MWYFWIPFKASVRYAFSLLSEYIVLVSLRHSCLLSLTLLLIGFMWTLKMGETIETNYTIKSYMHVSVVNEMSDKNDGDNEG